jgi:hypothetical protein
MKYASLQWRMHSVASRWSRRRTARNSDIRTLYNNDRLGKSDALSIRLSYSHLEDYCALNSPWIGMLVGMLDLWNILELRDVADLICIVFLWASSRMYISYYTVFIH